MPARTVAAIGCVPECQLLLLKSREHYRGEQIDEFGDFVDPHRQMDGGFSEGLLDQKVFALDVKGWNGGHRLIGEDFRQRLIPGGAGYDFIAEDCPRGRAEHGNGGVDIQCRIQRLQMLA
ncbi:hypothetical protein D3C85_604630 [compost metagenome]